MDTTIDRPRRDVLDRIAVVAGVLLHVAVGVFPFSASGLLAPAWFLIVVALLWGAGAWGLWRLRATRPRFMPLVAPATLAVWFVLVTLGELVLGWTA